jgi:predicted translation initiation factor SUI1
MAKSSPRLAFVAADRAAGTRAQAAFAAATARLGHPWQTDVRGPDVSAEALAGVAVVVALDLPDFAVAGWDGRVEHLPAADLPGETPKLVARLLGGSDNAVSPPPPPPPPKKVHTVKVSRETAGRRGKGVTVVSDLPLTADQIQELATRLKNACGTGGTAKDGRIEIQGDHRDKLAAELEKLGYKVKRAGG